jgi:predicted amidohydrolase
MNNMVKVAAVQMDPKIMENEKNLEKMLLLTRQAASNGAQLIAFPECALPGYLYKSREEAVPYAQLVPGPATERISAICQANGVYVVFGLIEIDGNKIYNTAAFVGPEGLVGKYRKAHLPFFGLDRFVEKSDQPFRVYRTPIANIGLFICHDCTFPESSRVMMLQGAEILVLITNWPLLGQIVADHIAPTRAVENFVHLVVADRVGTERGAEFIGQSKIINAAGQTKAIASRDKEEIVYAEVDISYSRNKHWKIIPGVYEVDLINERRPEFYGDIASPGAYRQEDQQH